MKTICTKLRVGYIFMYINFIKQTNKQINKIKSSLSHSLSQSRFSRDILKNFEVLRNELANCVTTNQWMLLSVKILKGCSQIKYGNFKKIEKLSKSRKVKVFLNIPPPFPKVQSFTTGNQVGFQPDLSNQHLFVFLIPFSKSWCWEILITSLVYFCGCC